MDYSTRERILAAINHEEADRVPMWEGFWASTLERWKSEGLPADADPVKYFGLDEFNVTSIDWTLQFSEEIIEETDEYTIKRTNCGALSKAFKKLDSTPFWSDFALRDRATWEELRERFDWNETRVDLPAAKASYQEKRDLFQLYLPSCVGFEKFKYCMGMEGILMALAEDPDWVQEMCMTTADMAIDGLEYLLGEGFEFDIAFVTEDMGFKDRGFFSPRTYREVIMPCQKKFNDFCHARNMKVMLHTCGQNMELVPLYIEAGYDVLNPMEVKAGMDIYKLKKDFGEVITLWGGIDVRKIADPDPKMLEDEIRDKVTMAKQGGGYIFASDHSIPDNVSLDQYRYMLELGHKYGKFE